MQKPVEIHFNNMDHSPALEEKIREHSDHLSRACPQLHSCAVFVETIHRRKEGASSGDLYEVRIDMHVSGQDLAVHHTQSDEETHHEDAHQAVQKAFRKGEKRLRAFLDKRKDKHLRGEKPARSQIEE